MFKIYWHYLQQCNLKTYKLNSKTENQNVQNVGGNSYDEGYPPTVFI